MADTIKVYIDGGRVVIDQGDDKPMFVDLDAKVDETYENNGAIIDGRVTLFNKANVSERWFCAFGDLLDSSGVTVGTTKAQILAYLSGVLKGAGSPPPSVQRVTTGPTSFTDATGSPVVAGARSITFFNIGAASVDINGGSANLPAGASVTFDAGGENDTLDAHAYDATGSTLLITTVT